MTVFTTILVLALSLDFDALDPFTHDPHAGCSTPSSSTKLELLPLAMNTKNILHTVEDNHNETLKYSICQVPADPAWGNHAFNPGEMYLGMGSSPAELLAPRRSALGDRDGGRELEEAEEARGKPPAIVNSAYNNVVGLDALVSPGQYARFQRTSPQLVLADTKLAYQSIKRRSEREGSTVLSSLHFTCSVRPDSVEVSARSQSGRACGE